MPGSPERKTIESMPRPRNLVALGMVACALLGATNQSSSPDVLTGPVVGHVFPEAEPSAPVHPVSKTISTTNDSNKRPNWQYDSGCSSIRFDAEYITMGKVCADNGAKYTPVDGGHEKKGWVYSVIDMGKGTEKYTGTRIFKCGYIRKYVLPIRKAPKGSITDCRKYYKKIVNQTYIEDRNCGDINGVDACKDAKWFSKITPKCSSGGVSYNNITTAGRSPWNIYGNGKPGFSEPVKENNTSSTKYRAQIKRRVKNGKAIVVRDYEWALMPSNCVKKGAKHRRGGTCKDPNKTRNARGKKVCGRL